MRNLLALCLILSLVIVGVAGGVACGPGAETATFEVTNLVIDPEDPIAGEEVEITVTVTNTSEADGSYTVTLKVDGASVDTESVSLAAGASDVVAFMLTEDTAGTYSIDVNGLTGTLTVTEVQPGELPGTYQYSLLYSDSDGTEMTMDIWVKNGMVRSDWTMTEMGEEPMTMIFVSGGEFDWIYYPGQNVAYKWTAGSGINPGSVYAIWFSEYYYGYIDESAMLAAMQSGCAYDPNCTGAAITGHETVAGEYCAIFTVSYTDGSSASMWISAAQGWLLKMEWSETGYTWGMEFANIDLSPTISDSVFDIEQIIEPDTMIMDMTGM